MLPAPRDPRRPEAASPDPPPDPPPLETLLRGLLQGAGAQAARAVDGSSGAALAEVGLADGDDVAALVEITRAASAAGRSRGEWLEDVVMTLGRTVHVLRECGGGGLLAPRAPAAATGRWCSPPRPAGRPCPPPQPPAPAPARPRARLPDPAPPPPPSLP